MEVEQQEKDEEKEKEKEKKKESKGKKGELVGEKSSKWKEEMPGKHAKQNKGTLPRREKGDG